MTVMTTPELQRLLQYEDRHFIDAAYLAILQRSPDPQGLDHYLGRLRAGIQKLTILRALAFSREAREKRAEVPGLRSALKRQSLVRLPIVGVLLKMYFGLEGDSPIEKRLRSATQEIFQLKEALQEVARSVLQRSNEGLQPGEDLNRRQLAFETQQLPTLLQSISEINQRQLASDNDRENLVQSVPVALRKLTRDLVDLKGRQESLEGLIAELLQRERSDTNLFERYAAETREGLAELGRSCIQEREVLRDEVDGRLHAVDRQLQEFGRNADAASKLMEAKIGELRGEFESRCNGMLGELEVLRRSEERTSKLMEAQIDGVRAQIASSERVGFQHLQELREETTRTLGLTEQRITLIRDQLTAASLSVEQRLIEARSHFSNALASIDQRLAQMREQSEGASRVLEQRLAAMREQHIDGSSLTERRIVEIREQLESRAVSLEKAVGEAERDLSRAAKDVGYLLNRVEFVRRELMFEMRYGVSDAAADGEQLSAAPAVVAPKKVALARKAGIRLNLGCGHVALDGYLNVDRRRLPGVDVIAEVDDLPFGTKEVEEIFSSHLIEHFPQEEVRRKLLKYWLGLLKPGGRFRVVAPDAVAMVKAYYNGECSFESFRAVTFGGQDYDGDFHFNMFSAESLSKLLLEAGFTNVRVVAENRVNGECREFEVTAERPEGRK